MTDKDSYHHGDLRNALLTAAGEILDAEGASKLSLRAVARRAGVSQTAPYRHFKDKAGLLAAIATEGFQALQDKLMAASADAQNQGGDRLAALGCAYVAFARSNTGLYRLMFGPDITEIDRDDGYWRASRATYDMLAAALPENGAGEVRARALAAWSLVHGLSMLILDGQVALSADDDVDSLVDQALQSHRKVSA